MPHTMDHQPHLDALSRGLRQAASFGEAAELLATWARDLTGAEAATIRLAHPGEEPEGWLPVCMHAGLVTKSLRAEAAVPGGSCVCGRVVEGGENNKPFFTRGGAFAWGRSQSLLDEFRPEDLGELRGRCIEEGFESIVVVPLIDGDERIGVLHLADHQIDRFDDVLEALEEAGRMAGEVLGHSNGLQWEQASRKFLEAALLPLEPPSVPGLELGVSFVTASTFSQMGGDFYEIVLRPDGSTMLIVGDYSGRGMEAAGMANEARQVLADLAHEAEDPAELLTRANRVLSGRRVPPSSFITAAAALVQPATGRLELALAGHPPPLIVTASEGSASGLGVTEIEPPFHPPLTIEHDTSYGQTERELARSDTLVLFTDGIVEARRGGRLFGVRGIERVCRAEHRRDLSALAAEVCGRSSTYHDPALEPDDRLVLVARLST